MPAFDTPQPIDVRVELGVGHVRLVASPREDTVVTVEPSQPHKRDDVAAAERTQVEFVAGRLLVKAPKGWRYWTSFRDAGSVDVTIELPEGSRPSIDAGMAQVGATGSLGDAEVATGGGDIALEHVATLRARTGSGDIDVDTAAGSANLSTGSGSVRVGTATGAAVIKNSNGDSWVGETRGDVRVQSANGDIAIDHTHASVVAKTANGDVRLNRIERGSIVAETAYGELELAIPHGTSAYLDLTTGYGTVRSELESGSRPTNGASAEIRGRTAYGDITVRRA